MVLVWDATDTPREMTTKSVGGNTIVGKSQLRLRRDNGKTTLSQATPEHLKLQSYGLRGIPLRETLS